MVSSPDPALSHGVDRSLTFRGRRDVVDALLDLVARAADGHGGALTVVGEPGIGKTAVLDMTAEASAKTLAVRVIRMRGVEGEVERPWSGLAVLVDGVLAGLDGLAPARALAVRAALSVDAANPPVEPFAVALGARDLLVHAAESEAVVVFVDDLQWVDLASRQTLSFIARRLQFERVAIISARRSATDSLTDTGTLIAIEGVADEVADGILVDAGVDSANVRRELVAACGGNPFVLVETARLLDADQRTGRAELPEPLPIGVSAQRVVGLMLARLPQSAVAALCVAAAETDGDLVHITQALARARPRGGRLGVG